MYRLSAHDNDWTFFEHLPNARRCQSCRELLCKWEEDLAAVKQSTRLRYDLSYTTDGVLVASSQFRQFVARNSFAGLDFRKLEPDGFWAVPTITVPFDAVRRRTRFENRCNTCGRWESIIGGTPIYLLPDAVVATDAIVRTDLEFGSGDEKSPSLLCGEKVAEAMKRERLRGLVLTSQDR